MEITKQNQTFNIKDTTSNGWTISGTATQEVNGYTSISFNISKDGELNSQVGYYSYSIPKEGMVNISMSAMPENIDTILSYAQTATQSVKDYLNNQTISK